MTSIARELGEAPAGVAAIVGDAVAQRFGLAPVAHDMAAGILRNP